MAFMFESNSDSVFSGDALPRASRRARSLGGRARGFSDPSGAAFGSMRLVVKHTFLDFEEDGSEAEETRCMFGLPKSVQDWDTSSISTSASWRACAEVSLSDGTVSDGRPSSDTASEGEADVLDLASDGELHGEVPAQHEQVDHSASLWQGACWAPCDYDAQWYQACYGQAYCPSAYWPCDWQYGFGMYPAEFTGGAGAGAQPSDCIWSNGKERDDASDLSNLRAASSSDSLRFKHDPEFWSRSDAPGRWADMDDDEDESRHVIDSA